MNSSSSSINYAEARKLLSRVCDEYLAHQPEAERRLKKALEKHGLAAGAPMTPQAVLIILEQMTGENDYGNVVEVPLSTKLYIKAEQLKKKNAHLYRLLLGYCKRQAIEEINQPLLDKYQESKVALERCEAQLQKGKTLEILNRQSPCKLFLKILSVISILAVVGIFTTAGLMIKRYNASGRRSVNFFKPLASQVATQAQIILKNRPSLVSELPDEIFLHHVLNNLTKQELAMVAGINQRFRTLAQNPLLHKAPNSDLDYEKRIRVKSYEIIWSSPAKPIYELDYDVKEKAFLILANGRIVVGHRNGELRILNTHSKECVCVNESPKNIDIEAYEGRRIKGRHEGRDIISLTALEDGKHFISFSADGFWRTWDSETGRCIKEITTAAFSWYYREAHALLPNGNMVIMSDLGQLQILDTKLGQCLCKLSDNELSDQDFSIPLIRLLLTVLPNGFIVRYKTYSNIFEVWNSETGALLYSEKLDQKLLALGILKGNRIIGLDRKEVRIWDSTSWQCQRIRCANEGGAILSDGRHMVIFNANVFYDGGRFNMAIFDTDTKSFLKNFKEKLRNQNVGYYIDNTFILPDGRIAIREGIYGNGGYQIGLKIYIHTFAPRPTVAPTAIESPNHLQKTNLRRG